DEVALDLEVALVDRGHERQRIHVLEDGTRLVVHDAARGVTVGQAGDPGPLAPFGDFLDGEIELVAGDEIDGRRRAQAAGRVDGDFRADEPRLEAWIDGLHGLDGLDVRQKGGR